MANPAVVERVMLGSLGAGVLMLGCGLAGGFLRDESGERARAGVEAASLRLERAAAARADGRRDEHFDALVDSLAAGLDSDTPVELAPALDAIRRGRERERAVAASPPKSPQAPKHAEPAADPDVDRGLAAARSEVDKLLESRGFASGVADSRVALDAAGAVFALAGTVASAWSLALRRGERRRIADAIRAPAERAHNGRLAGEVARRVAEARAVVCESPTQTPAVAASAEGAADDLESLLGRVLEIKPVEN